MLYILNRPPHDDHAFSLYTELYKRRSEFGLSKAKFIYMWTNLLGTPDQIVTNDNIEQIIHKQNSYIKLYFRYNGKDIAGTNRYLNTKPNAFDSFCEKYKQYISNPESLRTEFYNFYDIYHRNAMNTTLYEEKIQKIVEANDSIVLFVKDHFRIDTHKSWIKPVPELSEYFNNLCEYYPNKQFVIVTSLENLQFEITALNCKIIPMGGDITNQHTRYSEYTICSDKNMSSTRPYISLNRGVRNHRTYLVSALCAHELRKMGYTSYLGFDNDSASADLNKVIKYDWEQDEHYELTNLGYAEFQYMFNHKQDEYEIYPNSANDNVTNYNQLLLSRYHDSFVEFVSDTSYNEASFNITEKLSHSVFAMNFPLIVSSPGYVNCLRELGMDMFDDVINHSYDLELNKTKRIHKLITDNLELLSTDKSISLHTQYKNRLMSNIDFIQNKLCSVYSTRFWSMI